MIKFFRTIRYNLMETGKTTKYFKYAIGEIILVVIGILIALGINNWNENRKSKLVEKDVLNNIYENLGVDSIQFDYYKNQYKQIDKLHLDLYRYGIKNETIDSISEPVLIRRTLYFKQLITSDFKENLYTINNQKIKKELVSYIGSINDMETIYRIQLVPLINGRLKPYLAEQELYNAENWFELKKRTIQSDTFEEITGKNIVDKDKLLALAKTKKFQQLLFEVNAKWNEFYTRLETVIAENNDLRALIESELKTY
ncbi:hypothetical protein J4050_14790 [Winogradskyella sp. DF17]|uniref:Uncharacterized protein n=1 Tax=Winogradskyella pelagia TaxID=2819984 RepID=A0ABS3T5J3_9FLAO|nr:DUF6090 family protein [Winogradskyella sp. DF17]MBO3118022.1 hypothetical protein [Winogradskyella sp. DF17]